MSLIKCYGVFWERETIEEVDEGAPNQLRGYLRRSDEESIDFSAQAGVYVLYDGTTINDLEVVYVGQAGRGQRNLWQRLRDHFHDRHWNRWTHFSWFGLYPIEGGEVQILDDLDSMTTPVTLDMVEAILITLFEPKLNLQRGRWRDAVEVYQWRWEWDDDYEETDLDDINESLQMLQKRVKKLNKRVKKLG